MEHTPDARAAERFAFEEEVIFVSPRDCVGRGVDLAQGGLGVIVPEPFEAGQAVQIRMLGGRVIVQGTVRWCRPEGDGHRLGIQFTEEDWMVLEHLRTLQHSG